MGWGGGWRWVVFIGCVLGVDYFWFWIYGGVVKGD